LHTYQRQRGKHEPTAKQTKLIEKLEAELEEYSQTDDYNHDEEESDRPYELEDQLEALREACLVFSDRQKKQGGAIVTLSQDGALHVVRGLVAAADIKATKQEADDSESHAVETDADRETGGFSAKLVDDLKQHRALALRAVLADQPTTALAAVVHALALATIYAVSQTGACVGTHENVLDIRPVVPWLRAEGIEDSRAGKHVEQQRQAWVKHLPENSAMLWDWLRQRDSQTLVHLLGFCAAQTVKPARSDAFTTLAGFFLVHKASCG
jgi:ParB family chromosome partitioning protein